MVETDTEAREAPERTCAGCRERDAAHALLRFAAHGEPVRLVPDPRRRLPGRGVSVHPRRACLARAVKGGGFARSLRAKVVVDLDELAGLVLSQYEARIEGLLLAALRKRAVALGGDAARAALREGAVATLLLARDGAGRRDELVGLAAERGVPVVEHGTKSKLGRLVGRDELGVLAILDERIASELAAVASRAADLSEAE